MSPFFVEVQAPFLNSYQVVYIYHFTLRASYTPKGPLHPKVLHTL